MTPLPQNAGPHTPGVPPPPQVCGARQHVVPEPQGTTSPVQALQPVPCALQVRVPVWQLLTPGVPVAAS